MPHPSILDKHGNLYPASAMATVFETTAPTGFRLGNRGLSSVRCALDSRQNTGTFNFHGFMEQQGYATTPSSKSRSDNLFHCFSHYGNIVYEGLNSDKSKRRKKCYSTRNQPKEAGYDDQNIE